MALSLGFGVTVSVTGDDAGSDDGSGAAAADGDDMTIVRGIIGSGRGGEKAVGGRVTTNGLDFELICLDDARELGLGLGLGLALVALLLEGGVDLMLLGEP